MIDGPFSRRHAARTSGADRRGDCYHARREVEAEVHGRDFLESLRGRSISLPELIVSDAPSGPAAARAAFFIGVPWPPWSIPPSAKRSGLRPQSRLNGAISSAIKNTACPR